MQRIPELASFVFNAQFRSSPAQFGLCFLVFLEIVVHATCRAFANTRACAPADTNAADRLDAQLALHLFILSITMAAATMMFARGLSSAANQVRVRALPWRGGTSWRLISVRAGTSSPRRARVFLDRPAATSRCLALLAASASRCRCCSRRPTSSTSCTCTTSSTCPAWLRTCRTSPRAPRSRASPRTSWPMRSRASTSSSSRPACRASPA